MKAARLGFSVVALLVASSLWSAETVDEVLDLHIAARGGTEAWSAIETLTIRGQYTSFSKVAPFVWYHGGDQKTLFESHMNGNEFRMAYDGEDYWGDGWPFDPGWPSRLNPSDIVAFRQEVDQPSALFHARDRGWDVSLLGPSEFDGMPAIAVELVRPDGEKETWYLDSESYLEIGRESLGADFGRPLDQRYVYDDFREVGGVQIPHYVEGQWYTRHRVLEVESVEVNAELAEQLFVLPAPEGMQEFAKLGGAWEVNFESRNRPTADFESESLTAQVDVFLDGGLVQEQIKEPTGASVIYSLTYNRFQEKYYLSSQNDVTTHLDLAVGTFEDDGTLVLSNLETGTARTEGERTTHTRHRFKDLEEGEGFQWEVELSRDAGETWLLLERRTYRERQGGLTEQ